MKQLIRAKNNSWVGWACLITMLAGCQDLTEINKNPNDLIDENVNPAYVLTSVLSGSTSVLADVSFTGNVTQALLSEAMQYTQRDFLEFSVSSQFGWYSLSFDYRGFHQPLANAAYLERRAEGNPDSLFLKGAALTMQAMWFGLQTSLWGDIPYSEANLGTAKLQPVFDNQRDVFVGILADLDRANSYLKQASSVKSSVVSTADVLYKGDLLKWQKFANSLRLRYLMRLSEKTAEMNAAGVDVAAEFAKMVADPAGYPIITATAENAAMNFPGTNTLDSWRMGPLLKPTPHEFHRIKAAATVVDFLKQQQDPRLTVWFRPVEVQTLVRDKGAPIVIEKDASGNVKRYMQTYKQGIDTSLYVGLKIALADPDSYNDNLAAHRTEASAIDSDVYNSGAANPFVSYLGAIYRENTHPLVKSIFISAAEVNFTLAEAAVRGWIPGSPDAYYLAGIAASLEQYGIADGDARQYDPVTHQVKAFDRSGFLARLQTEFEQAPQKTEQILQQKWVAAFTTMEAWFDWRRTGFPDIGGNVISGAQGTKIPVRYVFGESEINYNTENLEAAVSRLEPAVNDQWSKMWLLQGTGKPW